MGTYDNAWYCNAGDQSTTGYYAVAKRPQNTAVVAGQLARQFTAPAVGSERVFVCIVAGTTANTTDATWVNSRGAKTTDGTATWQECTGASAVNGDLTSTPSWSQAKAFATSPDIGVIIKRNNGASYQICSTTGFALFGASEPAFSDTAGVTTNDNGNTWTSLGPVGNFASGGAPHARLANVFPGTWYTAGNTVYVADNHAESQATAITISVPASVSAVGKILCHNHSGSYPPTASDLTTGATLTVTGATNLSFSSSGAGHYCYGVTFRAGSTSGLVNLVPGGSWCVFDNCIFDSASNGANPANSGITISGGTALVLIFNNCKVKFGHIGQAIILNVSQFTWQNTGPVLVSGSLVPTNFIQPGTNQQAAAVLEALDLSQLTGTLINTSGWAMGQVAIKDCKLNASATIGILGGSALTVQLVRSDSSGTAYKSARYQYEGAETTETSITRVGGATDPTGQAQSRKIVTTANVQWLRPFKAEPYAIWNPVTGSNVTVTVYGTINAGALPFNDNIWMEVEYLGSSASPLGTIVTTTKANLLAANAAVASDSSTWGAPPFTTFNPADLSNITLSGGNLIATGLTGGGAVRSFDSLSSGKYYWEYTCTTINTNSLNIGIATAAFNLSVANLNAAAIVTRSTGGITIDNIATGSALGILNPGNVIGIAVDFTAQLIWFRIAPSGNWNGSGTANPATGTGGLSISALSGAKYGLFIAGVSDVVTANFGANAFTGIVPSGFTAGFPGSSAGWSPFKLVATLSSPQPGMAGYIHARVRAAKASSTYYIDPKIVLS